MWHSPGSEATRSRLIDQVKGRWTTMEKVIDGVPTIIVDHGRWLCGRMTTARRDHRRSSRAVRIHGVADQAAATRHASHDGAHADALAARGAGFAIASVRCLSGGMPGHRGLRRKRTLAGVPRGQEKALLKVKEGQGWRANVGDPAGFRRPEEPRLRPRRGCWTCHDSPTPRTARRTQAHAAHDPCAAVAVLMQARPARPGRQSGPGCCRPHPQR
jgi:hypothetical protein